MPRKRKSVPIMNCLPGSERAGQLCVRKRTSAGRQRWASSGPEDLLTHPGIDWLLGAENRDFETADIVWRFFANPAGSRPQPSLVG
jgi:hypothetical protein